MAKKKEGEKGRSEDSLQGADYKAGGDDEMDFSDPSDFEDDIDDEELVGDLLGKQPMETDGVEALIVVDGIPKVEANRLPKLQSVMNSIFSNCGPIAQQHYPVDANGATKGYVFIEYKDPASAAEATKKFNGHKLDKQHTFLVNPIIDFEKYREVADEWEPPTPRAYEDHGNLRSWVEDPECNDQYSVIHEGGEKVSVYWNSLPEPTLVQERNRWTESYIQWSPMGTYLATLHRMGVALWGGEDFQQIVRFEHFGVQFIGFSPNENYLITYAPHRSHQAQSDDHALIVWDVRTGQKKRGFHVEHQTPWPVFKWSHDDKYFARCTTDTLSVYETPSFGLLDKKSFKLTGIRDFSWSPSSNTIAYWVAEDREIPARVTLVAIPSRAELRVKNLFSVADCKMHWQKSGDYLCVKVDRYTKAKKDNKDEMKYSGMFYNFEVFHMKEKQIPVDSVEIKEPVIAFSWEPVGSKFAIIHGENPAISVSFFQVKPGQTTPVLLKKYDRKQCNNIFWSPQGQFCVLAGLKGGLTGTLDFIDTNTPDFTIMNSGEHFMASDVEWDPTGRYVVTAVSWWAQKVDNAYWVWSFQGKCLQKHTKEKFCQLLWRPRPPTLLSSEQIREIKKNLKKYSVDFELKDKMKQSKESKELLDKRSKLYREFEEYRTRRRGDWANQRKRRLMMRNGTDTDTIDAGNVVMEEETVEFLVKEEVIPLEE